MDETQLKNNQTTGTVDGQKTKGRNGIPSTRHSSAAKFSKTAWEIIGKRA